MAQSLKESPRRIFSEGNSPRPQTGLTPSPQHHQPVLAQASGQRQMLPPSPQIYHPRFLQPPSVSNGSAAPNATRDLPNPQQSRPSSSMSISSMLGSESDRPLREQKLATTPNATSPYHSKTSHPFSDMSPPQSTLRPSPGDPFKPRSQTPDRMGISNLLGARPQRSGSGSIMQGSRPHEDHAGASSRTTSSPFVDAAPPPLGQNYSRANDALNHQRGSSLPGVLSTTSSQSQLQPKAYNGPPMEGSQVIQQPETARHAWLEHSNPSNSMGVSTMTTQPQAAVQVHDRAKELRYGEDAAASIPATQYDVRPPASSSSAHSHVLAPQNGESPGRLSVWGSRPSNSISHDSQRLVPGQTEFRLSGPLLNGQGNSKSSQPQENNHHPPASMSRQDSAQSHVDRLIFGDRLDKGRSRLFSPFATSHTSQSLQSGSGPAEDQSRKGSDELSQHRALLGLAAEGKKGGRYSPLPQVVLGAQPQTLGPDVGIKTEHSRIFSGIGSGVGTVGTSPATGLPGLAASPFRRGDSGSRALNENNLMKMSRSTSGLGKREREIKTEDGKAASENDSTDRARKKGRSHLQHQRRDDLDASSPFDLHRRSSAFSSLDAIRRRSTPNSTGNPSLQLQHRSQNPQSAPQAKTFKPNTAIKIRRVVDAAAKMPRRHLGSFLYSPVLSVPDLHSPVRRKLNVSIRPKLMPSFKDALDVNCTYTVRVSRTWLRHPEREAICAERFLWGSGIYTDDSDPVAAAVHSGFVKGAWSEHVDVALLEQVIREQNPTIDVADNVPCQPPDPPADMDLHITLLVLPALERYAPTVRYGIKSRVWPEGEAAVAPGAPSATKNAAAPHDGVSFMVLDCQWRDDASARGQDRSAAARRRRLQSLAVPPPEVSVA